MLKITATQLAVRRGEDRIFERISFTLSGGEGLIVTGPNGAGKSTLLRALAGLLPLAEGHIGTDGLEADATLRSSMHFINALNAMKPALTVSENLRFWQSFSGAPWLSTLEAAGRVGLAHIHDTPFSDLSTGQKRRISLARLFLNRRQVWILDEPTSGLDRQAEDDFASMLEAHLGQGGLFVAATHLPLRVGNVKQLRFEAAG